MVNNWNSRKVKTSLQWQEADLLFPGARGGSRADFKRHEETFDSDGNAFYLDFVMVFIQCMYIS